MFNRLTHVLTPKRLLMASVVVACITITLKTLAWYITGSVGLLSDAMESLVNLAAAVFGLVMVTVAAAPPDDDHPYGHHKAEYFSSGFEGILIIAAALGIIWAAAQRFAHPQPLEQVGWGLALSVASSALNGLLAWVMFGAARQHRSIALEADGKHLMTDVWTSAGVMVGIMLVQITGWLWLDPVVAIGVALNILKEGFHLIWRSSQGLMDEAVEADALARIDQTLTEARHTLGGGMVVTFDHLRTRKSGQHSFMETHMHVPGNWTLLQASRMRAQVEHALMRAVPGLRVTIQMLPIGIESAMEGGLEMMAGTAAGAAAMAGSAPAAALAMQAVAEPPAAAGTVNAGAAPAGGLGAGTPRPAAPGQNTPAPSAAPNTAPAPTAPAADAPAAPSPAPSGPHP